MILVLLLLIAAFKWYSIELVGQLLPAEIALGFLFLIAKKKKRLLQEQFPRQIIMLGLLWLLSQIFTDIIRQSPIENALKGAASIIFFLIDFCALYLFLGNKEKRLVYFLWASAIGGILSYFIDPSEYAQFEPWKWALGGSVISMTYLLLGKTRNGWLALLSCTALGIFSFFMNARSMGGFTILVGLILYLAWSNKRLLAKLTSRRGAITIFSVIVLLGTGVLLTYQWAAESGFLPETVTQKYEMNKSSKLGIAGLIIGGRIEWVASVPAVIDSPIIGHGSWAEDQEYSRLLLTTNETLGTAMDEGFLEYSVYSSDLIPAHSYLMQAWVWAGILGAWFWIHILRQIIRLFRRLLAVDSPLQPIAIASSIGLAWGIFFSPFGTGARMSVAVSLVVIVTAAKYFPVVKKNKTYS